MFWTCLEVILPTKKLWSVSYGGSGLGKHFEKVKSFSNFRKWSWMLPKVYKHVLNIYLSWFFWKNLFDQCTIEGHDLEKFQKNRKLLKIPKLPKNFPKMLEHFWPCLEVILPTKSYGQFRMEDRDLEKISKKSILFQTSENGLESSQTCIKMFWTYIWVEFFEKTYLISVL